MLEPVVKVLVVDDPWIGVDVKLLLRVGQVAVLVLVQRLPQRDPRVALLGGGVELGVGRQQRVQVGRDPVPLLAAEAGLLNCAGDLFKMKSRSDA